MIGYLQERYLQEIGYLDEMVDFLRKNPVELINDNFISSMQFLLSNYR